MVGLMQIMIYLGCVYLVFKAFEIYMVAFTSEGDRHDSAVRFANVLIALAVIIAIGFYVWTDSQARSIQDVTRGLAR